MNRLREWTGVILFVVVVFLFSVLIYTSNDSAADRAERDRRAIAAQAEKNFAAIKANGDFTTCVWTSIIKPKVLGHPKRGANAIHRCEKKYLELP